MSIMKGGFGSSIVYSLLMTEIGVTSTDTELLHLPPRHRLGCNFFAILCIVSGLFESFYSCFTY